MGRRFGKMLGISIGLAVFIVWRVSLGASANNATWNKGDVFAGVGNGTYLVFDGATGTQKDAITHPLGGATAGCAFTPDFKKLYTAYFTANHVVAFDDAAPHNVLANFDTTSPAGSTDVT